MLSPVACERVSPFVQYFKMLKMGLRMDAVKHSMKRDGKDPSILDLDHNKSVRSQLSGGGADTGPPLKDDPEFSKVRSN